MYSLKFICYRHKIKPVNQVIKVVNLMGHQFCLKNYFPLKPTKAQVFLALDRFLHILKLHNKIPHSPKRTQYLPINETKVNTKKCLNTISLKRISSSKYQVQCLRHRYQHRNQIKTHLSAKALLKTYLILEITRLGPHTTTSRNITPALIKARHRSTQYYALFHFHNKNRLS